MAHSGGTILGTALVTRVTAFAPTSGRAIRRVCPPIGHLSYRQVTRSTQLWLAPTAPGRQAPIHRFGDNEGQPPQGRRAHVHAGKKVSTNGEGVGRSNPLDPVGVILDVSGRHAAEL